MKEALHHPRISAKSLGIGGGILVKVFLRRVHSWSSRWPNNFGDGCGYVIVIIERP